MKKAVKKVNPNYSFSSIFNESFDEYKKKFSLIFKSFLYIYFIPAVILFVLLAFAMIIFNPTISGNAISDLTQSTTMISEEMIQNLPVGVLAFGLLLALVVFVLYLMLGLAYIYIGLAKDNKTSVSEIWKTTKKNFTKYLGFMIVTAIFLILLYILLIIPGIIFTVYWAFAVFIFLNEKKKITASLKESKALVKGRWWKTFGYIILLTIILCVGNLILNLIPGIGNFLITLFIQSFAIIFMKNLYLKMKK